MTESLLRDSVGKVQQRHPNLRVRILRKVSESLLRDAVGKVQQRHPNLRVRIQEDTDHNLWFTSEGVKEIPIEVVIRESDEQWREVLRKASKIPFKFEERPAI